MHVGRGPSQMPTIRSTWQSIYSASVISFFIGVLSPLRFRLFSEDILHMHVAPLPVLSRKLIIKYILSSEADPIVAKQILHDARTMLSIPKNLFILFIKFIHQLNNFYRAAWNADTV